ncbi:DNA repair protein RecO [Hyphomicrobium methylovorum]|uniref:DNA repair protein RecO n=1 Tax=Hyphomicrobium methylovorum TaxID=84 RepID=UPI0015E6ED38|nr:DNA repair protein RecO [Hyphomicrobium methylovorum]MBA2125259.1 DNA repair protein RecO [Hyphomicrobium methylovorum]
MQWTDEAIVLSVKSHGETAAVVELWTRAHGRHLGLVHGGRSRRLRPLLQPGNHVDATWKARLSDQLGHVSIEMRRAFAAETLDDASALAALSTMTALTHLLPERDPHPNLYEITLFVLGFLNDATVWPPLLVRWELALLDELGFGLDLSQCAATGSNDRLIYVSPRTGRAVSASAGEPYRDKLLALPQFLTRDRGGHVSNSDIGLGFALTGHFLEHRVLLPRNQTLPESRARLLAHLSAWSPG